MSMTVVQASDQAISQFELPALDARALGRRVAAPLLIAGVVIGAVLLGGGRVHAFADGVRRGLGVSPSWAVIGVVFECVSIAGYVGLLSLVAGRATSRVGPRESAQITLAGAAATRLLPTAGAGGIALTLWALRRAGLRRAAATRTLLVFLIVLYSVFILSTVISGAALALGLVSSSGPVEAGAVPAVAGIVAIATCLALSSGRDVEPSLEGDTAGARERGARVRAGARLLRGALQDARALVRSRDPRLAGAIAYWAFDAAVVWAMLRAFGSPAPVAVVALAYFVGQVANTLPLPGSVSAGVTGVLVAFGVPVVVALPAVLAYRAIAVWLPSPLAIAAVPALRATTARWGREDARAAAAA
jgi:uncharacterized membrane protein YbhN (UPF0104 family)